MSYKTLKRIHGYGSAPAGWTAAPVKPVIKGPEVYKGNRNEREAFVHVNAHLSWVAKIVQHGTQEKYSLKFFKSIRDARWNWSEEVQEECVIDNKDEAVAKYDAWKQKLLLIFNETPVADGYPRKQVRITERPKGITDPKHTDYINCNLNVVKVTGSRPYNCYHVSDHVYERCDGGPLTQDDIDALKNACYGQIHVVKGEPGDTQAFVHSECDSGD